MTTISDVRDALMGVKPIMPPEYAAKMMHAVPDVPVVERAEYILERCRGKRVLELGASGKMHDGIVAAALSVIGIDREPFDGVLAFDLDDVSQQDLPVASAFPEIVVCGEVFEHLANPGWVIQRLRRQYACPLLVTVPNAFSDIARKHIQRGTENINRDHVAWYSWKTLTTLLGRYGYVVQDFAWYGGAPRVAEGLIILTE